MQAKFTNLIRQLDSFGVPLLYQVDRNESLYKSMIGGIATLLIMTSSLAYSIFVIYQWQTNQLSPKIQQSDYISDFSMLDFDYDIVRFYYWQPANNIIDPFKENVLIPIVSYTQNYSVVSSVILRLSNKTADEESSYMIPAMKLGFSNKTDLTTQEMYIQLVRCQEELLPEGEKCASKEIEKRFYEQQYNQVILEIKQKTIDSSDKAFKTSSQILILQVETQTCFTLNIFLQSTMYEINDAFLFGFKNQKELITGALVSTQTNSVDYCKQAFGQETYAVVYIGTAPNSIRSIYEYPHASDLLANIGSIISAMFLLKYLVLFFNHNNLEQKVIYELISLYYPQFSNIKINRNWIGKIKQVQYRSDILDEVQLQEFRKFMKKTTALVQQKLSVINLLYEISRLYFLLRSTKSISEIKKIHQIGVRINFLKSEKLLDQELRSSSRIQDRLEKEYYLGDDDISVLSLDERNFYNESKQDQVADEFDILKDYYEINKIE